MSFHLENAVPHALYDISLPLPERKEKALIFPTGRHAANFLGIAPHQIVFYRVPGRRVTHKASGKVYAVRIAKKGGANG